MTAPVNFRLVFETTGDLAAATPATVDVPINGAKNWRVVIKNTGTTNTITALTYAASPLGTLFGPAHSASAGIPLAHGDTLEIEGQNEPCKTLRLVLTSTSGTSYAIEAGGH
jgi:hypothetical protein